MKIRLIVLLGILALPLAGCWKEQKQVFDQCNNSLPFHSGYSPWEHVVTRMTICMDHKGYRVAFESFWCSPGTAVPRRSAWCYAPKGYWAGIGHELEMIYWGRQPGPKEN